MHFDEKAPLGSRSHDASGSKVPVEPFSSVYVTVPDGGWRVAAEPVSVTVATQVAAVARRKAVGRAVDGDLGRVHGRRRSRKDEEDTENAAREECHSDRMRSTRSFTRAPPPFRGASSMRRTCLVLSARPCTLLSWERR